MKRNTSPKGVHETLGKTVHYGEIIYTLLAKEIDPDGIF